MAETKIQWCSTPLPDGFVHPGWTFNTHWGCNEVSAECDNCYARILAKRWGFDIWGKETPRRFFGVDHWNKLFKYNKEAEKIQTRLKVFTNSMSDIFEPRKDLDEVRKKLFETIEQTGWLNYLVLTKHPNRILGNSPAILPGNVWLGTSVGVDKSRWRIPKIQAIDANVRFLSLEPLLQPLPDLDLSGIHWAVIGGESGSKRRPCELDWIFDLVQQCQKAGVAPFVKQLGTDLAKRMKLKDSKGGDITEWPVELQIREFPKENQTF